MLDVVVSVRNSVGLDVVVSDVAAVVTSADGRSEIIGDSFTGGAVLITVGILVGMIRFPVRPLVGAVVGVSDNDSVDLSDFDLYDFEAFEAFEDFDFVDLLPISP